MRAPIVQDADMDILFDTDDFAVNATLEIVLETPRTVQVVGILKTPYQRQQLGPISVDADAPTFTMKWGAVLSDVRRGDLLTIGSERFTIATAPKRQVSAGTCQIELVRGELQDSTGDTFPTEVPADTDPEDYTRPTHGILGKT